MEVSTRFFTIPYQKKSIDAACTTLEQASMSHTAIILTHGAGGDMRLSQLEKLAHCLAESGFIVIRFTCKGLNLGYRVKVYLQVLEYVHENYRNITGCFIGGRSMGARAAVCACTAATPLPLATWILGVICISYPLHTKENTSALRDSPLFELRKPVCFVTGTKDEMCKQDLFLKTLEHVLCAKIKWMEGGDHSIKVKHLPEDDVIGEISKFVKDWCLEVAEGKAVEYVDAITKNAPLKKTDNDCVSKTKPRTRKRKRDT